MSWAGGVATGVSGVSGLLRVSHGRSGFDIGHGMAFHIGRGEDPLGENDDGIRVAGETGRVERGSSVV